MAKSNGNRTCQVTRDMVKSAPGLTQSLAKSNGNHTCQVGRDMVKSVLGHTQS